MNKQNLQQTQLAKSRGQTVFDALNNNTNAKLIESIHLNGKPIFAIWETENINVSEPNLEEICLTFHITGSIRVRNNVIGHNNVKFNSIALYGLNSYEWNIYHKLRYAHLYFWKDLIDFDQDIISHFLKINHLHGIKDNWVEGLFKMILSYDDNQARKNFILKMYNDCFEYLKTKYLSEIKQKNSDIGGCTSFQVGKLQEFIENNYTTKINIDDFCATMNWSRSHLFREFKKTFGTTPYNFLIHKRLSIAKQLIESGETLEHVCLYSGIENLTKLNYFFQKYLGILPKDYLVLTQQHED